MLMENFIGTKKCDFIKYEMVKECPFKKNYII